MNTSADIWAAFARTSAMLALVLAVLVLGFYLIKRFSGIHGAKAGKNFIRVLCVHHLSPKEKLVLVDVLGDKILIGVTPSSISKISSIDKDMDLSEQVLKKESGFKSFLAEKLGKPSSYGTENMSVSEEKNNED